MDFRIYRHNSKYRKIWRNVRFFFLLIFIATALALAIKDRIATMNPVGEYGTINESISVSESEDSLPSSSFPSTPSTPSSSSSEEGTSSTSPGYVDLDSIPEYSGTPVYVINGNKPEFTNAELEMGKSMFIDLSDLDMLGRCGTCTASLGKDTLAGERDFTLDHVRPSGWKQERYEDLIDNGGWLYNRCHLIMYAVSGLTDDSRNLVTGTRYMNDSGMLSYAEKATQNYIIRKLPEGGRILYRATPIFNGAELVCRGVHIEAADIPSKESTPEECGQNFHINVFCYNVQPGVSIDYLTGKNHRTSP